MRSIKDQTQSESLVEFACAFDIYIYKINGLSYKHEVPQNWKSEKY